MNIVLDAALSYAARGWQILPCHTPDATGVCSCKAGKVCESSGKHPRIAWKGKASTDPDVIKEWWRRWPTANIGVATGTESNIIVMDVDGDEGASTIARHGGTETGPQQTTGRGEHRFLQHPGFRTKNFVKRDGLDLRGDGGLVIVAPSLHPSGSHYTWIGETEQLTPAPIPAWLLEMIEPEDEIEPRPISPDQGITPRHLAYAGVAFENELTKLSECGNGMRNKQLNESALKLGHIVGAGWLDAAVVAHALLTTATQIGLPKHEATATIKSGMDAGRVKPAVLEDRPVVHDVKLGLIIPDKSKATARTEVRDNDWLKHGVNARDLQARTFAHVNWPVANILSEGHTLLAGKPKSKKSWLALSIAVDVALGLPSLGGLETRQCRVIYLDLESNQRRMQSRLRAILGTRPWPDNLHIFTEWPRGELGILQLDEFKEHYPDTGLVIADILQNIRPARVKNANPYDEDYEAVKPLTAWGEQHHAGVLSLHHTRKAKADDVMDEISGSTGLSAGVSAMWVLGRMPNGPESVLAIRGRDIVIDDDMALAWDDYTCRFTWTGSAEERSISQERQAILGAMSDIGEYSPKDLASVLGKPVNAVVKLLTHLFNDRLLEKTGHGRYVKVMGRQRFGLTINSGHNRLDGHSGHSGHSGHFVTKVDNDTINFPAKVPVDLNERALSGSLSDASNTSQNAKVPTVPTSLGNTSNYDYDKQREREVITAIDRHDYKAARRAALAIRGRKDGDRLTQLIDDDERQYLKAKESNGGYNSPVGY